MKPRLTVFSLGDYTPDLEGFTEAKQDNAIEVLDTDDSSVYVVIKNAFTVARKLGYEICVVAEYKDEIQFLLEEGFTPQALARPSRVQGFKGVYN